MSEILLHSISGNICRRSAAIKGLPHSAAHSPLSTHEFKWDETPTHSTGMEERANETMTVESIKINNCCVYLCIHLHTIKAFKRQCRRQTHASFQSEGQRQRGERRERMQDTKFTHSFFFCTPSVFHFNACNAYCTVNEAIALNASQTFAGVRMHHSFFEIENTT